jgi:hypothetical protein
MLPLAAVVSYCCRAAPARGASSPLPAGGADSDGVAEEVPGQESEGSSSHQDMQDSTTLEDGHWRDLIPAQGVAESLWHWVGANRQRSSFQGCNRDSGVGA